MESQLLQKLKTGIERLALELSAEQVQKLADYIDLLVKWNKAYNLTAIRDPEEMVVKHLLDSLAIVPHINRSPLLDVGTGPGLPGIPLAITRPELDITLLDSNGKKTRFLTQAKVSLGLDNVTVIHGRVEQAIADQKTDKRFQIVTSRAFASLSDMVTLARETLANDGHFIAMKGVVPEDEMAELPEWAKVEQIIPLTVPNLNAERHLIILSDQH
ncbi:16S rRNA (guanine(527)-N(7))-methyltransferase RsmG [Litoribrevibacter albus]|uniref:Ribosomal RNA small subunit methyltransferase G n=1 Tax=Litoribrevibacter albus TaxID=1473156 RepID=A0AA37W8V1_9GAMM|nr:16S rRNA (guanine(527)-N(7))-methyltransferase RsmG [Litoribrevibacter albus]GLQ32908.1 ribosomal RNA small subunit methyltransferase G [Litoribrevibacter albus]